MSLFEQLARLAWREVATNSVASLIFVLLFSFIMLNRLLTVTVCLMISSVHFSFADNYTKRATSVSEMECGLMSILYARWQFPSGENEICDSPLMEKGVCINLQKCPELTKIKDVNLLRRFICGFDGNRPLLCCPNSFRGMAQSRPVSLQRPVVLPVYPQYPGVGTYPERPNNPVHRPRPDIVVTTRPSSPHPDIVVTTRPSSPHPNKVATTRAPPPRKPPDTKSRDEFHRPPMPKFLPTVCGFSNVSLSRVVGGSEATPGAWPWMAAIYVKNAKGYIHVCGGALVSHRHVVTAAHCTASRNRGQILPPSLFVVRLGDHNLLEVNDLPLGVTFDVAVERIKRHANFNPRTYLNDIALFILSAQVPFSNYIQPVCLPYKAVPNEIAGHYGFVTGWGYTKYEGKSSNVLMQAQLKIWTLRECADAFKKEVPISSQYICAGDGQGQQDSCQGDSGGPLVFYENDRFYLIGIVSFGKRCATPGYPGAYTRITRYLQWLNDNF